MEDDITAEAKAFDNTNKERVDHGHIPDMQRAKPCNYFYNNAWRRPYLAKMIFGKYFDYALDYVKGNTLLEVGCGLGHMSLEFARKGFCVEGLDVSQYSIEIAKRIADENPIKKEFGSLKYIAADFMKWSPPGIYDNICFFATLHHFDNPHNVISKAYNLLANNGRIIVVDTARNLVSEREASIIALIRLLLSYNNNWYEQIKIPETAIDLQNYVQECLAEYQTETDKGEKEQSPHDNASGVTEILDALRLHFEEISYEQADAFIPRMCGGIRAKSEGSAQNIAEMLNMFDEYFVRKRILQGGMVLWSGQKIQKHV